MARDSSGPKNQPQYASDGAPADAADLTEVAQYASVGGNRKVGTFANMNALTGADRWEGLEFWATDLKRTFRFLSGGWVAATTMAAGTFSSTVKGDGTTTIAHGLSDTPVVIIGAQSHPSIDVNSRYFEVVLFGSPTASNFAVRAIDRRTNVWAGDQSLRFMWTATLTSVI